MTLDESKRIYNLTDGLGQMNLLKGYQNEGHDSAHPDYGAIGQRPGGEQALNQLIDEGHKLNAVSVCILMTPSLTQKQKDLMRN